jgi:putative endonuclease
VNRQQLGKLGEKLARKFLEDRSYRILETGFRCRSGEIDIVSRHKDELVFVEVRTRSNLEFGTPEESIDRRKKQSLIHTAMHYISTHRDLPASWRIDVVAIEMSAEGKVTRLSLLENAIEQE